MFNTTTIIGMVVRAIETKGETIVMSGFFVQNSKKGNKKEKKEVKSDRFK